MTEHESNSLDSQERKFDLSSNNLIYLEISVRTGLTAMSTVRQYITLPRAYDLSSKATSYPLKTISNSSNGGNAQKPQFKVDLN